jgi:hypothetical protein
VERGDRRDETELDDRLGKTESSSDFGDFIEAADAFDL